MEGFSGRDNPIFQFTTFSPTRHGTARQGEAQPESHSLILDPAASHSALEQAPKRIPLPESTEQNWFEGKDSDGFPIPERMEQSKIVQGHWAALEQRPKKVSVPRGADEIQFEVKEVDGFLVRTPLHLTHFDEIQFEVKEVDGFLVRTPVEQPSGLSSTKIPARNPMNAFNTNSESMLEQSTASLCRHSAVMDRLTGLGESLACPGTVSPGVSTKACPVSPGSAMEVRACLDSISLELNRVASNFRSDSYCPHLYSELGCSTQARPGETNWPPSDRLLSFPFAEQAELPVDISANSFAIWEPLKRQTSESDFSTKDSSGDETNSLLAGPVVSLPTDRTANEADLVAVWSNFSAKWNSPTMPSWGAEYSCSPNTLGDYSMYAVPASHADLRANMVD